jgi:hypothetical protein
MAPRLKLFVLSERLQEKRPQPRKSVLRSSLGEGGIFSLETKFDRSWEPDAEHREVVSSQYFYFGNQPKVIQTIPN